MVNKLVLSGGGAIRRTSACCLLLLAGCIAPNPVEVDANFVTTTSFGSASASWSPSLLVGPPSRPTV